MSNENVGRFVWTELMAPNAANSSEFYRSLFGWSAEEMDMGEAGQYLIMKAGENSVGGIAAAPAEVPTHWVEYLEVEDVDAAAKTIEAEGGTLINKPFDIPNVGRAVFARDPGGAPFAAFKSADPSQSPADEPFLNGVCWRELMTENPAQAVSFYSKLVGWTAEPMGPGVQVLKQGDRMCGTVREMPEMAKGAPEHWMVYFFVDDLEAQTKKATDLSARLLKEPTEIPNMGSFSVLSDPQGGTFALWKQAPQA